MLLYLLLIFIVISIVISFSFFKKREKQTKQLTFKTNADLYDKEYVEVYDAVTYDYYRLQKDIQTIMPSTSADSYILDIGSGTGHHVHELNEKGIKTIGIDKSAAMVKYSKKNKHRFIEGNAMHMTTFHNESFTHITCFYYTLYCIDNKKQFLHNVYKWLTPGGLFIVHLSKKCTYGKHTKLIDSKYTYKRTIRENKVYETITKGNNIRRNEHMFYMESIPTIVTIAQNQGFSVLSNDSYDLYNELYIFKKPE